MDELTMLTVKAAALRQKQAGLKDIGGKLKSFFTRQHETGDFLRKPYEAIREDLRLMTPQVRRVNADDASLAYNHHMGLTTAAKPMRYDYTEFGGEVPLWVRQVTDGLRLDHKSNSLNQFRKLIGTNNKEHLIAALQSGRKDFGGRPIGDLAFIPGSHGTELPPVDGVHKLVSETTKAWDDAVTRPLKSVTTDPISPYPEKYTLLKSEPDVKALHERIAALPRDPQANADVPSISIHDFYNPETVTKLRKDRVAGVGLGLGLPAAGYGGYEGYQANERGKPEGLDIKSRLQRFAKQEKQAYHGLEVLKSAFGNSKKPVAPALPAPTDTLTPALTQPPLPERNKARDAVRTLTRGNMKALAGDFWNRMVAKYSKPTVEPYGEL